MKPNNPFLTSGYHSPKYFCDREKETSTLIDALFNGHNITLVLTRRMGKTGLIHNAFYHLLQQQKDVITLYMDIFSTRSLSDFVQNFAEIVLRKLDSKPQKAPLRKI